jgi:DNA invertase Pin-like site-specific DNA recombinase
MLFDELQSRGIEVFSIHENLDTTTALGRAMRDILIILAQLERDQIAEATKQRLAALRAKGIKLGRPAKVNQRIIKKIIALSLAGKTTKEIAREVRLSYGTVWNVLHRGSGLSEKGGDCLYGDLKEKITPLLGGS